MENQTGDDEDLPVIDLSDDENENWLRTVRKKLEREAAERRVHSKEPEGDSE
jgi:hypothetical protein